MPGREARGLTELRPPKARAPFFASPYDAAAHPLGWAPHAAPDLAPAATTKIALMKLHWSQNTHITSAAETTELNAARWFDT